MGGSGKMNYNNSKGRSYAMMLLMAFGAAVFAIMLLQIFREKRLFNLLIKEKDLELFSLHLLLQNERDHVKELKKKTSQMEEKVFSIRTQKINVESQILEVQSRIATLQDKQKAMVLALEERESEIKMMKEKEATDSIHENPQVVTLSEIVKQKEAEIEELKHRVESTDGMSKPFVNIIGSGSIVRDNKESDSLRKIANGTRKQDDDDDRRKIISEQILPAEEIEEKKNEDGDFETGRNKNNLNANEETHNNGKRATIEKENRIQRDRQLENLELSRENENQEHQTISAGMKLKMEDHSQDSANSREEIRGRHEYSGEKKGKRWRMLAKNRRVEHTKYSELKRSNQLETHNLDPIIKYKLIHDKDTDDISTNLNMGESLRLRRNKQANVNGDNQMLKNRSVVNGEASNITGNMKEPKSENGVKETNYNSNAEHVNDNKVEVRVEKNVPQDPDESSVGDARDLHANDGDIIVEPGLEVEDEREEYKEETDVSEF